MTSTRYASSPSSGGRVWRAAAWGLIAAGILFRLVLPRPTNFWEDEIIAATHAVQPFWRVIVDCIRYDVHPPLYFLQLHVWGWAGHGDSWLLLNSVAWSIAALGSMWWTARRLYDARTALIATLLFAVSPVSIFMATQLRMYAMLSALIVWAFYLAVRSFGEDRRGPWAPVGLAAVCIAIVNTHAIGAIAVLANGLYALSLARARTGRGLLQWFAVYAVAAVFAVPWLVSGMIHDANLGEGVSSHTVLVWLGMSGMGNIGSILPPFLAASAVFYVAVVAGGLLSPRTRAMTLAFLVVPVLVAAASALAGKTLFKWNFFSTAASPFIVMVLAQSFAGFSSAAWRRVASAVCAVAFLAVAAVSRFAAPLPNDFRGVAALVRTNYRPGDLVYAPQLAFFWGMAWYLVGPDWGSPLAIAAAPNRSWRGLYAKLGPKLVDRLGLMPRTQMLSANGVRILTGVDSAAQAQGASRVWLVMTPNANLPSPYPPETLNGLTGRWAQARHGTRLILYAASPQKVVTP